MARTKIVEKDTYVRLIKNILILKKRSGLSEKKFSELIRVSRFTVHAWFDYRCNPQNEHLIKISMYMGILIDDLIRADITNMSTKMLLRRYNEADDFLSPQNKIS